MSNNQVFYPIYLNLSGRKVVVFGGGDVAERKVVCLAGTGAVITVVSPNVTPRIAAMANSGSIELRKRAYERGDCSGATLVLCATGDSDVNSAVRKEATAAGILMNMADEPALCDFYMPAVVRRGELTVAISTGGTSPALAAKLRKKLSKIIGPEYARLLNLLAKVRPEIRRRIHGIDERKALQYEILNSDVMASLKANDIGGAEKRLREIIENFACQVKTS